MTTEPPQKIEEIFHANIFSEKIPHLSETRGRQDRAQSALKAVAQFASVAGQVGNKTCSCYGCWRKSTILKDNTDDKKMLVEESFVDPKQIRFVKEDVEV